MCPRSAMSTYIAELDALRAAGHHALAGDLEEAEAERAIDGGED